MDADVFLPYIIKLSFFGQILQRKLSFAEFEVYHDYRIFAPTGIPSAEINNGFDLSALSTAKIIP